MKKDDDDGARKTEGAELSESSSVAFFACVSSTNHTTSYLTSFSDPAGLAFSPTSSSSSSTARQAILKHQVFRAGCGQAVTA